MRADQDWRIPVIAFRRLIFAGLWLDVNALACLAVIACQVSLLPLRIDDIRVFGIDRGLVTIAEQRNKPVGILDTHVIVRARRPTLTVVVLGAAVHVVKRFVVVNSDLIVLSDGHVVDETPCFAKIVRFVNAAIVANQQIVLIIWVERHRVMVDVLGVVLEFREVFSAVFRHVQMHVHLVNAVKLMRAREQLLVVVRACSARQVVVAFLPGFAAILRSPETAFAICQFDCRVNNVRFLWRNCESCLSSIFFGQTLGEFAPGCAAVLGFVNTAGRAAVY